MNVEHLADLPNAPTVNLLLILKFREHKRVSPKEEAANELLVEPRSLRESDALALGKETSDITSLRDDEVERPAEGDAEDLEETVPFWPMFIPGSSLDADAFDKLFGPILTGENCCLFGGKTVLPLDLSQSPFVSKDQTSSRSASHMPPQVSDPRWTYSDSWLKNFIAIIAVMLSRQQTWTTSSLGLIYI
ncbi:hypothetical protein EV361DRAFT_955553 [Lentinula raphanica]|uniref:Uncharacterized protein n=1 Tax=Lentinula raphanica TaxID=153919 RepID=A0AA38NWS6_9AGAR|nr:hypothetical protein F5878DRAFT_666904 [Lentinula raphanica]KAJ3964863.1 hypothetical protein EV361DRAFT_955553 [Lentinula raphanica]